MTVRELYEHIDGSYEDVKRRMPTEALIERFVRRFPSDGSYAELMGAIERGDVAGGFEASHKLKGVAGNLGLTGLYRAAYDLTEVLRRLPKEFDLELVERVRDRYTVVIKGILDYENEKA